MSYWRLLGSLTLQKNKIVTEKEFRRNFKLNSSLVNQVYKKVLSGGATVKPKYLLWTLFFLNSKNSNDDQISSLLGTTRKTMMVHIKEVLEKLIKVLPKFNFGNRFKNWPFLQPSCLVDTTKVLISPPFLSPWEYYDKEQKVHCLLYQITCSLGKPFNILSFDGPFKGSSADVSIFRSTIVPLLEKNEKVMCDKGYWQEVEFCWCPPTGKISKLSNEEKIKRRKVTRIRHLNERVISRLHSWGCFQKKWKRSWTFQSICLHVVARLTQLELYSNPLS